MPIACAVRVSNSPVLHSLVVRRCNQEPSLVIKFKSYCSVRLLVSVTYQPYQPKFRILGSVALSTSSRMMNIRIDKFQRVIQYFWDPPIKNDDPMKSPIWCLGKEYSSKPADYAKANSEEFDTLTTSSTESTPVILSDSATRPKEDTTQDTDSDSSDPVEVRKESDAEIDEDGWPRVFLDDVDAKFWMTYRSGFSPIPLSSSGRGNMSLTTRLRSLADQEGFTSDTGWGCMIRSGQCVLANALSLLKLGRGMKACP